MLNIEITCERLRETGGRSIVKSWRRRLPERWSDVPAGSRLRYWRWILEDAHQGRIKIAREILNLPKYAVRVMSDEELGAVLENLAWMKAEPNCMDPVFPSFFHKCGLYYLPTPGFENGACLEFTLAEGYYDDYVRTQNPHALVHLVATLCRGAKADKATREAALASGDIRVPLFMKDEVEDRAERLKGMPGEIAWAVLLYFAGVKQTIASMYQPLFKQPELSEDGEEVQEQESTNGPLFGWWSRFMEVAETGLFGTYEEVLQKRLHLICMYLMDQHVKNERLQEQYDRINSKNRTDEFAD